MVRLFSAGLVRNQAEPFADSMHMRVHRKGVNAAGELGDGAKKATEASG